MSYLLAYARWYAVFHGFVHVFAAKVICEADQGRIWWAPISVKHAIESMGVARVAGSIISGERHGAVLMTIRKIHWNRADPIMHRRSI